VHVCGVEQPISLFCRISCDPPEQGQSLTGRTEAGRAGLPG
jgi:hypothetical protein